MYYIYQRISTEKQSLIRQEGAIADYCKANNIVVPAENVYSDVITGKTIKRDKYVEMKSKLNKGDILIMLDLDRLGRNWDLIKNEWKALTDKGVYIIIVNCPLINVLPDSSGSVSIDKRLIQEMMFTLLCYVSQKEVEKVSIRTKEALKAKREQGVQLGRPTEYSDLADEVKSLYADGHSTRQIAERLGISKSTVARMVKND
jgi:DNA invertase Pin-like site-specific DNA recombinase